MPHQKAWKQNGIHWTFSGVVTLHEQQQADAEMYGDERFEDIKYYIWDGTQIERLDYPESDADMPAAIDRASNSYNTNLKGALVSNNIEVRKIIKRYISTSERLKSTWDLRMFNSLPEAIL